MKTKQETGIGHSAKEYNDSVDLAEKECKVETYCRITIERNLPGGGREILHSYDLPREMVWKYDWVYEWRKARYICLYPKDRVSLYFHFYDRTTGMAYEYKSLRSRQVAARALITRYTNAIQRYTDQQKGQLFFDPENDEILKKAEAKIAKAKARYEELSREVTELTTKQQ